MNIADRRILYKNIKRLDPTERYVKINFDEREIRYSDTIKQHIKIRERYKVLFNYINI